MYHSHLKVLYVLQKAIQLVTPAALFLCHSIPVCVSWVLLICEREVICLAPSLSWQFPESSVLVLHLHLSKAEHIPDSYAVCKGTPGDSRLGSGKRCAEGFGCAS